MTKDEALRLALAALEHEAQRGNDNAYQYERDAIKAALEAKDEPVAWKLGSSGIGGMGVIVEPQRTWVGLTDEEVADIERNSITRRQAIRAIEAKLRSKNYD